MPLSVGGDHIHSGRTESVLLRIQKLHELADEKKENREGKRENKKKKKKITEIAVFCHRH